MDFKILFKVFTTIFIAELGDRTQIATMLFATNKNVSKLTVFLGSSLALILVSALSVLVGGFVSQHINEKYLLYAAGIGFIGIGIWTILSA